MHLCEEIIVEEGAQSTDVHQTSGTRRIPDPHFVDQRFIRTVLHLCYLAHIAVVLVELGINFLTSWITCVAELPQVVGVANYF